MSQRHPTPPIFHLRDNLYVSPESGKAGIFCCVCRRPRSSVALECWFKVYIIQTIQFVTDTLVYIFYMNCFIFDRCISSILSIKLDCSATFRCFLTQKTYKSRHITVHISTSLNHPCIYTSNMYVITSPTIISYRAHVCRVGCVKDLCDVHVCAVQLIAT